MVGNWYARVFAVSADNPQEGIRSLPSNVIEFSCFYDNPIGPPPVLESPLGNPTLTLPVTLKWAHVPNGSASFTTGTSIRLSVTNSRDAVWSGACSSGGNKTKTCTFTLTGDASVTANVQ